MKTQGFTLVELLAVIVILAVLALIATPVVLSIIDDAKESAMLRSAEMYLSGVENAVMRENMNSGGNFRPSQCTITTEGNLDCEGKDGIIEVEVNGEKPKNGNIVFENGKIKEVTLTYESGTIVKDNSGNLVYEGSNSNITYESLDNWQHKTMDGIFEEHLDEDINGVCDLCNETEIPGLYKTDGTFVSWEQLTSMEYCTLTNNCCIQEQGILKVSNNVLYCATDGNWCCNENLSSNYLEGKLIISDSVKRFAGMNTFNNCRNLTSVIIPNSVTEIDQYTFSTCVNLTSVEVANSVTAIYDCAFENCFNLTSINYNGTKTDWTKIELKTLEDNEWNYGCPEITVHCTDGDIVIPAYS